MSSSVAVTVVTAVWFSTTLAVAVEPPPSEVITGTASFTSVTVTVMVCVSALVPSLAFTSTT